MIPPLAGTDTGPDAAAAAPSLARTDMESGALQPNTTDAPRADRGPAAGAPNPAAVQCPFQAAIDLLSRKHALTLLWLLEQSQPRRFNEIRRALDINPASLSQRLDELESAGVVRRASFDETPPRVEYSLTPKGTDLLPLISQIGAWARKHGTTAG